MLLIVLAGNVILSIIVIDFHSCAVPDEEKIEKRAGKIAQEFKALVFPDGYQPGSKRKVRTRVF